MLLTTSTHLISDVVSRFGLGVGLKPICLNCFSMVHPFSFPPQLAFSRHLTLFMHFPTVSLRCDMIFGLLK